MVGSFEYLNLAIFHPQELRAVLNYKIWREDPIRKLNDHPETSRINHPTMRACWDFLDQTSRSFSAVVKELDTDLSRVICIFYLILRGLDTVEDDMTIEIDLKEDLLKNFYLRLDQIGWNFEDSGPDEKDRKLLVEFDKVIEEFQLLEADYRTIITDVTARMGGGMAKFARMAADQDGILSVETMNDYDSYCHYVAGIVGEGLSRIFSSSGKEDPGLAQQIRLSNSMGLMLQKTNILRDFREDIDQGRLFWPKEIWSKHFQHPRQMIESSNLQKARWALSEMTLDALCHAIDSLEYLTLIRNQSVFNFCAVPQVMAIATLEICFNNLAVFERNVKIRRSKMIELSARALNPRDLSYIFSDFAQKIHAKIDLDDPSYLKLCEISSKIVAWTENRYPSYITPAKVPPLYSDDPAAGLIDDARIQQQPVLKKNESLNKQADRTGKNQRLTIDELKFTVIIVSLVVGLILIVSLFIGGLIYLITKGENDGKIKLKVPLTSIRVEL
ncbi:farnesyl-diphosphate farnesyltransferase [Phakopsora pachyrhizi]|uniref:Squalene synthase n=1 Tax=Phakopsora pachyrhizi TaxID=170000 RepID=A0AAV0BIH1_PHAPC|nr:farnesyl-diphosphate farnesyltransferase [Phakopsora pachyrhizi]CAH7674777.1 farnesyl-diphosphate farnesyltransferase [Phakopsora pachyrhizi]CAH7686112.1 farnesyl-diphosphate farnesyltransferase [Phakopsora pachyrhizi]